jgi:hypothetical protein
MKLFSPRLWAIALAAIGLTLTAQPAKAAWVFVDGNLSAQADFSLTGNILTVTLTNTASVSPTEPAGVLTALFFNYQGPGGILSANSATASGWANYNGSFEVVDNQGNGTGVFAPQGDIGGEWGFRSAASGFNVNGNNYGISSSGLSNIAPSDFGSTINGNNLTKPDAPDGIQWGIVNSGYVDGSGNGGIKNEPFVQDTATIKFTVTDDFLLSGIKGTEFVYGTAYGEGGGPGGGGGNAVPAPAGLILLATALPVFALRRIVRRKRVA